MTELTAHERRLERAFGRYLEGLPVAVDAVALTEAVAAAHERRQLRWRIQAPGLRGGRASRPVVAVLLLVGLLVVVAVGLALVGGRLHRELPPPQHGLVPTDIDVLQPDGWAYEQAVVDGAGMVWAAGAGHVLRFDPATGDARTWTVADDAAFGSSDLRAPARRGGVWLFDRGAIRRLDGDGFQEVIDVPFESGGFAEAPNGDLWVGVFEDRRGVRRWDGSAWTDVPGWDPAIDPAVIAVDRDGHAWVGASTYPGPEGAGLWSFDGRSWTKWATDTVPAPAGVVPPLAGWVGAIAPAADGSIWVVTERAGGTEAAVSSLLRFDGSTWTEFGSEAIGFDPMTLSVARDGTVWTVGQHRPGGGDVRIARFDGQAWRSWDPAGDGTVFISAAGATVAAVDGAVFVGTGEGLYRLVDEHLERAWPPAQEGPSQVTAMLPLSRDEAWAGGGPGGGAWHFSGSRWESVAEGLAAGAIIFDLARAPDGRLWAAAGEGGLVVLDGDRWTVVDDHWCRGLALAADGTVWAGGHGDEGGIRTVRSAGDGGWIVSSVTTAGLSLQGVEALAIDRAGTVWAVTFGYLDHWFRQGLARFDGKVWEAVDPLPGISDVRTPGPNAQLPPNGPSYYIEQLVNAADGIWVRTTSLTGGLGAVSHFDGATWTAYRGTDSHDPAWLAVGPDGSAWVSGSTGLARFDGARWVIVRDGALLGYGDRFAVAPDGTVWATGPSMIGRFQATSP